ncbi:hypothetical protein FJV76_29310 [Mesorhizobium sp. WSM4303]|uniref:hypothetical protein n=1 Tax=unclassified Mesorhizobium TaxID=325217 RepID=UPI00115EA7FF|nr:MULTISPECIES: hypothetical protein [unclassified Mesorhizobium]TRC92184.1 hypothetical protein FJV77_25895 [Mesorhizobium sp. WSM4306]TRC95572.1 hypothetical protein FJV76_29310 [Mesorhizobium sp. WSM4303]
MTTLAEINMAFDTKIAEQLEKDAIMITDKGATPVEMAAWLAMRKVALANWKAESIEEFKRFAMDPSAHGSVQ